MEKITIDEELKSHFLNLYAIALSDTEIETTELEFLFKFGEERGISKRDMEEIILNPDKIKFQIPEDTIRKIEYLYDFTRMIWIDGKVDEFELMTLKKFCKKFGFEEENIDDLADFLIAEVKKGVPKADLLEIVHKNL